MGGLMEGLHRQRLLLRKKYFQKSGENPAGGITTGASSGKTLL
jgi:hypothetical protein